MFSRLLTPESQTYAVPQLSVDDIFVVSSCSEFGVAKTEWLANVTRLSEGSTNLNAIHCSVSTYLYRVAWPTQSLRAATTIFVYSVALRQFIVFLALGELGRTKI